LDHDTQRLASNAQAISDCSKSQSAVLQLDIHSLDEVPPEVWQLSWLEELWLSKSLDRCANADFSAMRLRNNSDRVRVPKACHLAHLRVLIANGVGLDDRALTALAAASAHTLRTLECAFSRVTTLTPLKGLPSLQHLDLRDCQALQDVSALQNLAALQTLDLRGCDALQDVTGLQNLAALQTLDLSWCPALQDVSALKNLTSLQTLDLRGCDVLQDVSALKNLTALQTLDLSFCRALQDVSALKNLTSLQHLDLRSCDALQDVSALQNLTSLQHLDLSGCDVLQDVSVLQKLTSLQELVLRDCPALQDVSVLQNLTSLRHLVLSGCEVLQDVSVLKDLTSLQSLDLSDCPALQDVPQELVQNECSAALRGYFRDLAAGAEADRTVRVLLIGNGYAGKSTLAYCLMHSEPPSQAPSRTHAIVSQPLAMDGANARLWDFAGQEIYHATHRLFLRNSGIFVLVWTEPDPGDPTPQTEQHAPGYWLDLIKWYGGRERWVLTVKNKIDTLNACATPPELAQRAHEIAQQYNISAMQYTNVRGFQAALRDTTEALLSKQPKRIGASWIRARTALRERSEKDLSYEDFLEHAREHGVLAPDALLTYLTNSGEVFYARAAFSGHIFLDQSKIVDAVYRIFDPISGGPRDTIQQLLSTKHGTVSGKVLKRLAWPEMSETEVKHYLTFLTGCEIAIELKPDGSWFTHDKALRERTFVFPALLPEISADELQPLRDRSWAVHLRFTFPLLHRAVVERILVRSASRNGNKQWWRSTAAWFDQPTHCHVLFEAEVERHAIVMRIAPGQRGQLAEAASNLIKLMQEVEQQLPHGLELSDDGEHFATLAALVRARDTDSDVSCGDYAVRQSTFKVVYQTIGQSIPEPTTSSYPAPSVALPSTEPGLNTDDGHHTTIAFINSQVYIGNNHSMSDKHKSYNITDSNVVGSNIGSDGSTATGTQTTHQGPLTQEQYKQAITKTKNALNNDEDALGPVLYNAIGEFLQRARSIQVEQRSQGEVQQQMKEALDEVWAKQTLKDLKHPLLPEGLETAKVLLSNPLTAAIAKALIGG